MSYPHLSHLACLKASLTNLAPPQGAIAGRLVDRMIVEGSVAPGLKAACYAVLLKRLPDAEAQLQATCDADGICREYDPADALRKMETIAAATDIGAFDEFLRLAGELRRGLRGLDDPQAASLCSFLVGLESDYRRAFGAAVEAQAKLTAVPEALSAARNVKAFDEKELLGFIRRTFENADVGIEERAFVSGGFSKFTLSLTLSKAKHLPRQVILRGDAGNTFGGASVVDEYGLLGALHDNGVCVPKPLALEAGGAVFGAPFFLMERRPGTAGGHMFDLPDKPNPALCRDVAAKLASIHRVPLAAVAGRTDAAERRSSDKARAWIGEAAANWKRLDMPSVVFEAAFDWLARHADVCDRIPRALVHADYGLNNLLVDDGRVSAVLDWEFAHIGNPAYDLGYFHPVAARLSSWEDFLQGYADGGMPVPDGAQLDYAILLAATRLGVMVCQTAHAFTSGKEPGLAGAAVIGGGYCEEAVLRISAALDRVL